MECRPLMWQRAKEYEEASRAVPGCRGGAEGLSKSEDRMSSSLDGFCPTSPDELSLYIRQV